MDEEFEPKKIQKKNEEVPANELNTKLVEHDEIKESNNQSAESKVKKESKIKGVGRIISRIIWALLFLFIIFEAVIGVLDMNRLNNDKEPVWYFSSKKEKENNKEITTYNLGLYVIVREREGMNYKISLKPFFLK